MKTDLELLEARNQYNASIKAIDDMPVIELEKLIAADQCPYQPELLLDLPIEMQRCPVCNEMVVAGLPHPRLKDLETLTQEVEKEFEATSKL